MSNRGIKRQKQSEDDSFSFESRSISQESNNYDIVTFDIRIKLLKYVCLDHQKTSRAARMLHVNQSTAKYIVRTFLQKGKILEKYDKKSEKMSEQMLKELNELKMKMRIPPKNKKERIRSEKKASLRKVSSKSKKNGSKTDKQMEVKIEHQQTKIQQQDIKIQVKIQENPFVQNHPSFNAINSISPLPYWPYIYGPYSQFMYMPTSTSEPSSTVPSSELLPIK